MNNKTLENPTENSNKDLATKPELDHLRIHYDKNFIFHSRYITSDDKDTDTGFASTASFDDDTVVYDDNGTLIPNTGASTKKTSTGSNNNSNTNTVACSVSTEIATAAVTPDTQLAKKTANRGVLSFDTTPGKFDPTKTGRAIKKSRKDSAASSKTKSCSADTDPALCSTTT